MGYCGTCYAESFRSGQYRNAALEGIEQITKILATYFPPRKNKVNELSNKPVIIKMQEYL